MSAQLKGFAGTVLLPGYTFANDLNTGLYRIAADNFGASAGGTKILDISATGLGVTGDESVSGILSLTGTSHMALPTGTTAQRPVSPAADNFRYNSTLSLPEFYNGSTWLSIASPIIAPQGRLTLVSGVPVIVSDQSAKTAVYYTPYQGGSLVPISDGSAFNNYLFGELTLTLAAAHAANSILDFFVINDAGTIRLVTGPAWTTATAGSGARGTGASTTELQMVQGTWTNKVSMTARNGATTYTVAANCGTYVGSIYMDGTNGQVSCLISYGQSRKWGIWNAYNRVPVFLKGGDPTGSPWTYSNTTVRASNGDSNNKLTVFSGLPEEVYNTRFVQKLGETVNGVTGEVRNGIGYNVTNAYSGEAGSFGLGGSGVAISGTGTGVAQYLAPPSIGINNVQACESAPDEIGRAHV